MPRYAIISDHPPNACPSANKAVREQAKKLSSKNPEILRKHGIKPIIQVHLDPGHKVFTLLEAPTAEAVRDMLYETGFMQYNEINLYLASSLEDMMKATENLSTIF